MKNLMVEQIQFRKLVEESWIDWIERDKNRTRTLRYMKTVFMSFLIQIFWKETSRVDWPKDRRNKVNTTINSRTFWEKLKDKTPDKTSRKPTSNSNPSHKLSSPTPTPKPNSHHKPEASIKALQITKITSTRQINLQANTRVNYKAQTWKILLKTHMIL